MSHWETNGRSDDWYTPAYIFAALGCEFDMDVAAARGRAHVPARRYCIAGGLTAAWRGFVWMNPPFGPRNGLTPWLDKFCAHGDGIALVPDRTSAPWFQQAASKVETILFIAPKVKFERPNGVLGKSPSTGTALFGVGPRASAALVQAATHQLGLLVRHS